MRQLRTASVVVFLIVSALAATPAFAETRTLHLSFTSTRQSMWGPGSAAPPFNTRFTILNPNTVNFDVKTPSYPNLDGPFVTVDTFFWGDVDFGIGAKARAAARLGLFADVSVPDPGSVDVTYPVIPVLTFPDANSFRAGDTVTINSSYSIPANGFSLMTRSPKAELELKGDFGLHLDLYGKACIVACLDTTQVLGIPSPIVDVETGEFRIFKLNQNSSIATPPEFGLVSPISGDMHAPNIDTTGALDTNNLSLVSGGHDQFVNVGLDLGAVAEDLFHIPVPLSFDTASFGNFDAVSGVHFSYTIVGATAGAHLTATQSFRFDPDPKVVFSFPEALQFWVNGGSPQTAMSAEMKVGDTLHLVTSLRKDPPMPVTPTFRLDNQFHSETGLDLNEDVNVQAGAMALTTPSITIIPALCIPGFCIDFGILGEACVPDICTPEVDFDPPDFSFGPLYNNTFPIANQHLGNLVSGTWQMQGFTPQSADALSIDPENPIISIAQQTGATTNLGSGKRLVLFAIDIGNPGDVLLSQLSLKTHLQDAFANARSFSIDHVSSCGLNVNPSFDGIGNTELLAAGNTLPVHGSKRVNVFAVVSPKPDPAPYVDNSDTAGESPLHTPVSGNASSSVLLGPSNPKGAGDFVLFGDHFVKLDAAGNIFGHVGSNDQVEVKNGMSGIIAGDLRGGQYIRVSGNVSADYAISGGVVDVVGKGTLTLFGNMKQFQTMSNFTMNGPAFQPTSALSGNVWVPAGGTTVLDPGYYGYVTINTGGNLELHSGVYFVNTFDVRSGANVKFDAPVNLIVGNDLELGANAVVSGSGSSRDSVINALQPGDITTGTGLALRGTLIAPRSNLMFGAQSRLEGSVYGKSITMNAGSTASYHHDCDPLVDANCDGTPDCP